MNQNYHHSPERVKYTAIVFFGDGRPPLKYRNVTFPIRLGNWIVRNIPSGHDWVYMNLYNSRTKDYIGRVKNPTKL